MSKTPELDSKSDEQLNGNQSFNNMNNNNNNNTNEVSNITNGIEESGKSATHSGQTDSNNSVKRKFRTLTFGRRKKSLTCPSNKCKNNCNDCNNTKMSDTFSNRKDNCNNGKKKKSSSGWAFKFCARTDSCTDVTEAEDTCSTCICTAYKKTDEQPNESDSSIITVNNSYVDNCNTNNDNTDNRNLNQLEMESNNSTTPIVFSPQEANELITNSESLNEPYVNSNLVSGDVNAVNNGATHHSSSIATQNMMSEVRSVQVRVSELALALRNQLALTVSPYPYLARWGEVTELTPGFLNRFCLRGDSSMTALSDGQQIHTQIDYIHCLVPDLLQISNCSFYWGKMDRYEAERLLDNKPEGTFLLRDSAQEEHLFSVSFRRFDRSLHARIEQWNHRFSFDSHDPGVYASTTVCGLIEHYKDPSHCMFFEPMLTIPLHRNFTFSLQHLSRATISSLVSYDSIQSIQLPKRLKNYLKEYHYKQQVRVRRLDSDH